MHTATFAALCLFLAAAVPAQCSLQLASTTNGLPGVDGSVTTLAWWDPDGSGPLPERLVVAGEFALAGTVSSAHIAAFDPATGAWQSFANGLSGPVDAVAPRQNGRLLAAANHVTVVE